MEPFGQNSSRAAEYAALIRGVLPLGKTAFIIALIAGLYRMRLKPLLKYPPRLFFAFINMLLYSAITSFMAVSAVMLLPRIVPDYSRELELGVLIMVSLFGIEAFLLLARRVFGPSTEMFLDRTFLGSVRTGMTEEQCARHVEQCPFLHEHEARMKNRENA